MSEVTKTQEFELPEDMDFDFPDGLDNTALEIVIEPETEDSDMEDANETSLPEVTEEKVDQMRRTFIIADEIETMLKDGEEITNSPLKTLYSESGLEKNELIFNTSPRPSSLNNEAAYKLFEEIKKHYNETFTILFSKLKEVVNGLYSEIGKLDKGLKEDFENIRYRASTVQTNYINPDNTISSAFATPISEFYKLLERDYIVSGDFKKIYKICDEVLDMKDKSFSDIARYLEILYNDWLKGVERVEDIHSLIEKLSVVEKEDEDGTKITTDGYYESSFRDKLNLLSYRDQIESIVINTDRIKEILSFGTAEEGITSIIMRVMFDEL